MHIHHNTLTVLPGSEIMLAAAKRDFIQHVPATARKVISAYLWTAPEDIKEDLKRIVARTGQSWEDVGAANLVYELTNGIGCTSLSVGGVHARNLDWGFPDNLLRTQTVIAENRGVVAVTWPGLTGIFTGMSVGKFSITINFVVDPTDSVVRKAARMLRGDKPAAWVVRDVLQRCLSYAEAKKALEDARLVSPCLFTLTGTKPGEACVIQKFADGSVPPRNAPHALCTNDYEHSLGSENVEGYLGNSSCPRYESVFAKLDAFKAAGKVTPTPEEAFGFITDQGMVLNAITAHQVVMRPSDGYLEVRVPGGETYRQVG
jgi:hypothetical protein